MLRNTSRRVNVSLRQQRGRNAKGLVMAERFRKMKRDVWCMAVNGAAETLHRW
ncbi:MAG TPA: hypothetical protein VNZ47_01590 [Candidatus Dormibacteraeota bacterium]|jgi:hypothetical protein|nr:hypothetical protein [Candidatus Dormibacteraeota bacterium]